MHITHAPKFNIHRARLLPLLTVTLLLAACGGHEVPKPVAYIRIDMPDHSYTTVDTAALPFTFEKSDEATITWKRDNSREKWIDLNYPAYRGVVFLSYKTIAGEHDLKAQIDTAYKFLSMHFDHTSGIDEKQYIDTASHVYANTSHLLGPNVASTYQFWVTDSVHHFLGGALYIDRTPNNDSLAPVLEYLQEDINHLIESIRWR